MGHDILLFNKQGKEIGYLRFSMWDETSAIIYHMFNVPQFNGYVSGRGEQKTFHPQDVRQAVDLYKQKEVNNVPQKWRQKDIESFLSTCEHAVKKDGEVTIYFG